MTMMMVSLERVEMVFWAESDSVFLSYLPTDAIKWYVDVIEAVETALTDRPLRGQART
jgi:hypothetical protein